MEPRPSAETLNLISKRATGERHGHSTNPDYESVALHIFTRNEGARFFTRTARNRNVPQVRIDPGAISDTPPGPLPLAKPGRCAAPLRDLQLETAGEILEAAAQFRMRQKAARLARALALHGKDEALYQSLATTLGYKTNKLPFTLLAQRVPLAELARSKNDLDALLFGVSGFLGAPDLKKFDHATRGYLRDLWEAWWRRRGEFERIALPAKLWKLSGLRPANHPQRRVAALAQMVRHWPKIRALAGECDVKKIRAFFDGLQDAYWDFHYTVSSKPSRKPMALVGESRVTEMLANVFFRWQFCRMRHAGVRIVSYPHPSQTAAWKLPRCVSSAGNPGACCEPLPPSKACCKSTRIFACATSRTARSAVFPTRSRSGREPACR